MNELTKGIAGVEQIDGIDDIDPQAARQAFAELTPLLDELATYRKANLDINRAAIVAASVGRLVKRPAVRARFAALPAAEFDIDHVDRLESAALATWHASVNLRTATVHSSAAQVPEDVADEVTEVKQRMMRVLTYYLAEDSEVASELSDIRAGTGHIDSAVDLVRLANLYEAHSTILATDRRHYRADDQDLARRLSLAIHRVLGDGRDSSRARWAEYRTRAWTLLINTYEEVSSAGRWLFRNDDGERRFPSLYGIGRQRRRTGEPDPGGDSPGNDIDPGPAEDAITDA